MKLRDGFEIELVELTLTTAKPPPMRVVAGAFGAGDRSAQRDVQRGGLPGVEAIEQGRAALMLFDEAGNVGGVRVYWNHRPSEARVRSILDLVRFEPTAAFDPLAQLDIGFRDLAGWEVYPVADGTATIGEPLGQNPKDAAQLRVFFHDELPPRGKDLMWFHAARLEELKARVIRSNEVTIDGMVGIEFEAVGSKDGHEQSLFGVSLGDKGTFSFDGRVALEKGPSILPTMRRIARSFHRVPR